MSSYILGIHADADLDEIWEYTGRLSPTIRTGTGIVRYNVARQRPLYHRGYRATHYTDETSSLPRFAWLPP
ncbi:MAG: hypothetical protein ACRD7E_00300 [Bryobacteraceae bacterium]